MGIIKHRIPWLLLSVCALCALLWGCEQPSGMPPEVTTDVPSEGTTEMASDTVSDTTSEVTSDTSPDPDHEHTATEWQTVIPPTCTSEGRATGTCTICGEPMETTLPSVAHTYTEEFILPICEAEGYTRYTCACGDTYNGEPVPAAGHTYTEEVIPPTCEAEGYTRYTCACGDTYNGEPVPAAGHTYTEEVIPPTCEAEGYTRYTCACGDTYNGEPVPAAGHTYTEEVIPPTCEAEGYTRYLCAACGHEKSGDITLPMNHANATAEVFYPTVSRDGYTLHTCPDCGHTYEDTYIAYSEIYGGAYVSNTEILMQGIDTSKWNHEYGASLEDIKPLDFAALKAAGVDFVILKAGSTNGIDPAFELDYRDAKAAGLQVGAYFYAYSTTPEATLADAEMLLSWLEGKQFELPIYFDMEETSMMSLGGELLTELCRVFVTRLQEAGYYAALYTNTEWLYNLLDTEWVKENLDVWYARYTATLPEGQEGFTLEDADFPWKDGTAYKPGEADDRFGMWQYTDSGIVEGFRYKFDFNYAFKDYKTIMETWGLNGFSSQI